MSIHMLEQSIETLVELTGKYEIMKKKNEERELNRLRNQIAITTATINHHLKNV